MTISEGTLVPSFKTSISVSSFPTARIFARIFIVEQSKNILLVRRSEGLFPGAVNLANRLRADLWAGLLLRVLQVVGVQQHYFRLITDHC